MTDVLILAAVKGNNYVIMIIVKCRHIPAKGIRHRTMNVWPRFISSSDIRVNFSRQIGSYRQIEWAIATWCNVDAPGYSQLAPNRVLAIRESVFGSIFSSRYSGVGDYITSQLTRWRLRADLFGCFDEWGKFPANAHKAWECSWPALVS